MLAPMPRAVRRPAGAARLAAVVLGALLTTSCGSVGQPAPYDATGVDGLEIPTPSPDPADFVAGVDNPWFPLPDGRTWRYVVVDGGERLGSVTVTVLGPQRVAGLEATTVTTRTRVSDREPVRATRYYAQDDAGNVWLVGEDVEDGGGAGSDAGWRAGEDGAQAGLAMPAEPRVGDGWLRAQLPGTEQIVRVDDPGDTAAAGVRGDIVRTTEDDGTGTRTENVYASGLGLVESVVVESDVVDSGRTTTLVSPQPG